jgi:hypothetical protein
MKVMASFRVSTYLRVFNIIGSLRLFLKLIDYLQKLDTDILSTPYNPCLLFTNPKLYLYN